MTCHFFFGNLMKRSCEESHPERKSHKEPSENSLTPKSNMGDENVQAVWKVSEVNVSVHFEPTESL
jgi:hypothetical protein